MFDILIYVVGYEARSSHIVSTMPECKVSIAVVMDHNRKINFAENRKAAEKRKSILIAESDFASKLSDLINGLTNKDKTNKIKIGIDVSSMNRELLALAIANAYDFYQASQISLTLLYAIGKYQTSKGNNSPYLDLKPINTMEGWSLYPERPLSLLIGLGYEEDHAAAAAEYFDPSGIWAFMGDDEDKKWTKSVSKANNSLSRIINPNRYITYETHFPASLFADLRSLVRALSEQSRVVIMSGGPKLFSAIAILVKLEVGDEVSVWQASSHEFIEIRDTVADGSIIQFEYSV